MARFLTAVAQDGASVADLRLEVGDVNGAPAILVWTGTAPYVAVQVHVGEEGLIDEVLIFLNPDKLTGLVGERRLSVR